MAVFTVNGRKVEAKKNQKLLRFLRDELHLTSVKDGCSEGACGACTVIIDGRTCKACVPDTDLLDGRKKGAFIIYSNPLSGGKLWIYGNNI